jgi:hypothetical protein
MSLEQLTSFALKESSLRLRRPRLVLTPSGGERRDRDQQRERAAE